mgnify:CR=1 FL=1
MDSAVLEERVRELSSLDLAYNDALYDLIRDAAVNPVLLRMNQKFGDHSVHMRGGGGQNGSDTTAIEIMDKLKTKVVVITLSGGWRINYNKTEYGEFAVEIYSMIKQRLQQKLGLHERMVI